MALPPWFNLQIQGWQARIDQAENDLTAVSQWLQEREFSSIEHILEQSEIDYYAFIEQIMRTRAMIALGQTDQSLDLLAGLYSVGKASGRVTSTIEVCVLEALAWQLNEDATRALEALKRGMALAQPKGFMRIFLDEGKPMIRLLRRARQEGVMPDYAALLLEAASSRFERTSQDARPEQAQGGLIEPLSQRELEVLNLIAEGLTNRETAGRLFLSLNTIKVHTRNIYGKLGVNNRTQAVARARELGLLDVS
jgi:LuxR family maltose regulon positive regulatory protein